jgi:murein DD-endopeptidase MepM/ murein hydrolase activator NlpD
MEPTPSPSSRRLVLLAAETAVAAGNPAGQTSPPPVACCDGELPLGPLAVEDVPLVADGRRPASRTGGAPPHRRRACSALSRVAVWALVLLAGLAGAWPSVAAATAPEPRLEVRFSPQTTLFSHPLDEAREVAAVLVQNLAVRNHGTAPCVLERLELELLAGDEVVVAQRLAGDTLTATLGRGARLAAAGMLEALAFHFRPQQLLGGATVAAGAELAPGNAALVGHRVLAFQGEVDTLRVTAHAVAADGAPTRAVGTLAVRSQAVATLGFPLRGTWFVAAAASFHTHHRWVVPEEFALDVIQLGAGGGSFRGNGAENADFYAWDAEIRAAASGTVVRVVDRFEDIRPLRGAPGESADSYGARIQAAQQALLAQGLEAIGGNLVVVDHGDGTFAHYAHLRAGSVAVAVGQRVERGTLLGRLGNSGNSTEPHLHFQLTDGPDTLLSRGLPVAFDDAELPWADAPRGLQSGDLVVVRESR